MEICSKNAVYSVQGALKTRTANRNICTAILIRYNSIGPTQNRRHRRIGVTIKRLRKKGHIDANLGRNFQNDVSEKQQEILQLTNQINALTGSDDYTLGKRADLEQQRADLQKELDEMLYDNTVKKQY